MVAAAATIRPVSMPVGAPVPYTPWASTRKQEFWIALAAKHPHIAPPERGCGMDDSVHQLVPLCNCFQGDYEPYPGPAIPEVVNADCEVTLTNIKVC